MEQEMKYVYEVYRRGSFSKAAEVLFLTQPALSIAVGRVEARLGMPLFERGGRAVRLTAAGEIYVKKYLELRALEEDLLRELGDLSELKGGNIRVGGTHYFNAYILPPVLADFANKYPGVELSLTEASSDELMRMLKAREIDLTFNCGSESAGLRRVPCFKDTILLCVPKSFPMSEELRELAFSAAEIAEKKHLTAARSGASLAAFRETPFVLLTAGNNLSKRSDRLLARANVEPVVRLRASQLVTAWHLALAGVGATFVSDFLVTGQEESVLFYRLDALEASRAFDMVFSARQYFSAAMKAFLHIFQARYGGAQGGGK